MTFSKVNSANIVDLYSDGKCLVERNGGFTWLNVFTGWSPAAAKLARRFRVDALKLLLPAKGQSLDFLSQFPQLRALKISARPELPWNKIESLSELKSVALFPDDGHSPVEIDFTRFKKLTQCRLSWKNAWASVLKLPRIRDFEVHEGDALRELDCGAIKSLERLTTLGCTRLQTITLNNVAELQYLWVNNSPKLKLDWERFGRDLEYFTLIGRLESPLGELRNAKKLVQLQLFAEDRIGSLSFLRELKKLYVVETDATVSKADRELIDKINEQAIKDFEMTKSKRK